MQDPKHELAANLLQALHDTIGPGFHPETLAHEYVAPDGSQTFRGDAPTELCFNHTLSAVRALYESPAHMHRVALAIAAGKACAASHVGLHIIGHDELCAVTEGGDVLCLACAATVETFDDAQIAYRRKLRHVHPDWL